MRGIAGLTSRIINPSLTNAPDLRSDPSNQQILLKATSDPDAQIRQIALQVYAFTYKLTPDLEDKIIAEFNSSESELPHQESQKAALLEVLMIGRSPSPRVTQFLSTMLDNPKYSWYIANRMGIDQCPLSDEVLDKLATKLSQEKDPSKRAEYARAIGAYGKQAQRYTPQLQTALAKEKDDVAKVNIKAAIDKTNQ